jgi:hypothetical protein
VHGWVDLIWCKKEVCSSCLHGWVGHSYMMLLQALISPCPPASVLQLAGVASRACPCLPPRTTTGGTGAYRPESPAPCPVLPCLLACLPACQRTAAISWGCEVAVASSCCCCWLVTAAAHRLPAPSCLPAECSSTLQSTCTAWLRCGDRWRRQTQVGGLRPAICSPTLLVNATGGC